MSESSAVCPQTLLEYSGWVWRSYVHVPSVGEEGGSGEYTIRVLWMSMKSYVHVPSVESGEYTIRVLCMSMKAHVHVPSVGEEGGGVWGIITLIGALHLYM